MAFFSVSTKKNSTGKHSMILLTYSNQQQNKVENALKCRRSPTNH